MNVCDNKNTVAFFSCHMESDTGNGWEKQRQKQRNAWNEEHSNGWTNHQSILHAFIESTWPNAYSLYDVCLLVFPSPYRNHLILPNVFFVCMAQLVLWCDDVIWDCRHTLSLYIHIHICIIRIYTNISVILCFRMYSLKCNSHCDTHNWRFHTSWCLQSLCDVITQIVFGQLKCARARGIRKATTDYTIVVWL